MNRALHILHLEDRAIDAELAHRELQRAGLQVSMRHAATAAEFAAGLREPDLDVILADYALPDYDGLSALELAKKERPEVPFIFLSGSMGEEKAIDALHHGATDYVLKQRLERLGPAVHRSVREIAEHDRRQKAEQALRENETLLRSITENSEDVIFVKVRESRFVFMNPAGCRLNGKTQEQLIGRSKADFHSNPVEGAKFMADDRRIMESGQTETIEEEMNAADGTRRVFLTTKAPRRDDQGKIIGLIGIAHDITERKRAEMALQESEVRFHQFAENIGEVLWMTNPEKTEMLYISPAYEKVWGRTCESLYQQPRAWLDAVHPKDRKRILEAATTRQTAGTYDEEYRIVRPDGSVRWIHDRAFPVRNQNGAIIRIIGVAEDITRHKDLEEQIRHAQKMDAFGQLAGGVAHDFNNLLQAILGYTEIVLKQTPASDPRHDDLAEIKKAGSRAADLTRQLLALGRKQNLDQRITDINALIEDLNKMLARVIGENIRIEFDLARNLDRVLVDPGQIGQILLNLAVNARDAMPRGGQLTFKTASQTFSDDDLMVHHESRRAGTYICVSVTDTGTGMPPEILKNIFQPFFTTKAPGKGSGLGLATSYGIASQHGGWLDVYSEPGSGSCFKLYLPAIERTAGPVPPDAREKKMPAIETLSGAGQRILFVEDEDVIRDMVQRQLQRHGYTITAVATAAVDEFVRTGGNYDLVLTDVVLPDISGLELLEDLIARKPGLRVLISSGYTDNEKRWPVILKRKWAFIGKPYTSVELLTALRNVFATA